MTHSSPTLSRRAVLAIAAAIGGGALSGARPGFARQATPAVAGGWPDSILNRSYDAARIINDDTSGLATFADLELQTIATGSTRPPHGASDEELMPWLNALSNLALPNDFGMFLLTPEWHEFSGFGAEDVYQTAEIGDPPSSISTYAGTFDREAIIATWSNAGYEEVESGDAAIYSISEDESFDFTNPIQKMFLARHNNAAIIGDDLVIFTSRLDNLQIAVAAATGPETSLAENPRIVPLLAATPALATGAILPGSSIALAIDPALLLQEDQEAVASAIANQMAAPQMPLISTALIGASGGGPYPTRETANGSGTPLPTPELARVEIALLTLSAADANQAIEVAGARLETMIAAGNRQPFHEMFASWELWVDENAPVARLSLELGDASPRIWSDLLYNRDLGFIG